MKFGAATLIAAAALLGQGEAFKLRKLGKFSSPFAAFTSVHPYEDGQALYTTHFGRGIPASIDVVKDIGSKLDDVSAIQPETFASGNGLRWPNDVDEVPEEIMGPGYVAAFDGFFRATPGGIYFFNVATGAQYNVSTPEAGFYYHMGVFRDVDGDGNLDLVSSKSSFTPPMGPPPFPAFESKLVWFRNPGDGSFPWAENFLLNGPDIHFRLHDFDGDGTEEVVAAQFSSRMLALYYNTGSFANPADWNMRIIDNNLGFPFDVNVADLNFDGKMDLLVTNHENLVETSAVYGYEVPEDLVNGQYTRHTLANNFPTTQPGPGQFSPGAAQAIYPTFFEHGKPLIVVSGDGNQRAHLLYPQSHKKDNWDYYQYTFDFYDATVGAISFGDVDGDGFTEIFVPAYDSGELHVYTFAPKWWWWPF